MAARGSLFVGWRPVAAGLALAGGREVVVPFASSCAFDVARRLRGNRFGDAAGRPKPRKSSDHC
jgi:hypothetical protein